MKKRFKIIIIAIILILGIVILFCSKVNKISLIENIKQKIAKTEKIQTTNEITIVDITDLEDDENLEHEHINKTMYNENNHWEECIICNEKINFVQHTYIDNGWSMGTSNNCYEENTHKFSCKCGHSYETIEKRKEHKIIAYVDEPNYYWHVKCENCNSDLTELGHKCRDTNGLTISEKNLGYCPSCKYTYTKIHHGIWSFHPLVPYKLFKDEIKENLNTKNQFKCFRGNDITIGVNYNTIEQDKNDKSKFIFKFSINIPNNIDYVSHSVSPGNLQNIATIDGINLSGIQGTNEKVWNCTAEINLKEHTEIEGYVYFNLACTYKKQNGSKEKCSIVVCSKSIWADSESPKISKIDLNNNGTEGWSKNKTISISGTENYCNSVTLEILDDTEKSIYKGVAKVTNGKYSINYTPEIKVEDIGKIFKVIVIDNCKNKIEQEFAITKVDSMPPAPTSGTEILGDWAKSKDFTFTATDYGIGEVQVAFNDIKDLKLAKADENTYSRDYTFTGDVYQPKQLSVMYKDGLGNTSIQKITIDKIDNTVPNITNAELYNNKITVTSHDEHETLGEGSGVVKYRYLASEEKLENPVLTKENSTEVLKDEEIKIKDIYKMKYIYAVAEDYVGNISEVYEFKVPELKVTAIANSNTSNGKGEIILDWSSYDVTDKYFVVYRKKENQEYWEKIVPLEQKLTGSTYTDTLANDETNPNTPSITIISNATNNNINITPTATDNGSTYTYYIEAYDSTGILLSKSN